MSPEVWAAIGAAFVSPILAAFGTVFAMKVEWRGLRADLEWIKRELSHHMRSDEQQFSYVQQRLDVLADRTGRRDRVGEAAR